MSVQIRSQADMALAARRVEAVYEMPWAADYGRLCHDFPVMTLTCGLCQAVAFSQAKAAGGGNRADAHKRLLADVAEIVGVAPEKIAVASAADYMHYTRRILAAWIYFKRFAVSILKVERGGTDDD